MVSKSSGNKSAPFSTHARGVPLFDRSFVGAQRSLASAFLDLRDMGSSIFWFLSMQSWLTLWSCLVNIVSVVFYNFYRSKGLSAPLDLVTIEFVVVLPLIGFIYMLHNRRNTCLDLLSEVKTGFLYLIRTYSISEWHDETETTRTEKLTAMSVACHSVLAAMHDYFLPSRFYSTRYPYLGYKSAMYQIAIDRSNLQRQMRLGLEQLDALSLSSTSQMTLLRDLVHKLHLTIDKLSNVKEFGSPQAIRAMVRCYICIIIPVFWGPYWALISQNADFAVAFFVSVAFQVALTGLLNVAITLEDPFDNVGLCGVFIDEQLYEIEHALGSLGYITEFDDGDAEADSTGGGGGVDADIHTTNQHDHDNQNPVVRVETDNV